MRLINTKTFKLEEFSEGYAPPYAILSHTWGKDSEELTFREVDSGKIEKPGVGQVKLRGCCAQAEKDGLAYAWIDTCCIDKTNLVELSEAINSMYRWYSRAAFCYAYLPDVPDDDSPSSPGSRFQASRWFTRGWTLQELLAPRDLRFYNTNWRMIGTKGTLCSVLMRITLIPRHILLGIVRLHTASVAQRMSWAAQRETKRAEDLAYCLLGIFGITMPMIYGEGGEQAFFRLQEQIMKTTSDDSILAWGLSTETNPSSMGARDHIIGGDVLAAGPSSFAHSGNVVVLQNAANALHSIELFGGSLRVQLPLVTTASGEIFGLLSCGPRSMLSTPQQVVGIPLAKASSEAHNEYVRPRGHPSMLQPAAARGTLHELIHIRKDSQREAKAIQQYWLYEEDPFIQVNLALVDVEPQSCWDTQRNLISPSSEAAAAGRILLRFRHSEAESRDFIMILEVAQPGSKTGPQFYTVICRRETPLLELAGKYQHKSSKASREASASNGILHLSIKLEPLEGNLLYINPEALANPPHETIDATAELEKRTIIRDYTRMLGGRRRAQAEKTILDNRWKYSQDRLQAAQQERKAVEDKIKELEAKRDIIARNEQGLAKEVGSILKDWREFRRFFDAHNMEFDHVQRRLESLQRFDDCEEGMKLLQDAADNGDAEVLALYRDRVVVGLMNKKYNELRSVLETVYRKQLPREALKSRNSEPMTKIRHDAKNEGGVAARQMKLERETQSDLGPISQARPSRRTRESEKAEAEPRRKSIPEQPPARRSTGSIARAKSNDNDFDFLSALSLPPLIAAAAEGNVEEAQRILRGKVKLDRRDGRFGRTALSWASAGGHGDIVQLLLATGKANVNSRDNDGKTALHWATARGHENVVRLLLGDKSLDVNSRDNNGWSPMHLASWESREDIIRLLNRGGAEPACQQTLTGHESWVNSVAFSHDSKLIVSGSSDCCLIWETATGQILQVVKGPRQDSCVVAFSQDSKLVLLVSNDNVIALWDVAAKTYRRRIRGHKEQIMALVFSNDSSLMASGCREGIIRIWNRATGTCQQTLRGNEGEIYSVAFSHDSKILVSGCEGGNVWVWDTATGTCRFTLRDHKDDIWSVAISPNSELIASGSVDKTIKIWKTSDGECIKSLDIGSEVAAVAFSPDSRYIASGTNDTKIRIFNAATGECAQMFYGHKRPIQSVAFSHDSKLLVSGADDNTVRTWPIR